LEVMSTQYGVFLLFSFTLLDLTVISPLNVW
jgi:hypothetical protein